MRAAFFLGYANPLPSAAWTRIRSFADRLAATGDRVDIVGLVTPTGIAKAGVRRRQGLRFVNVCPGFAGTGALPILLNLALGPWVAAVVFLLRPQLVVLTLPNGSPALGAFLGARIAHARVVVDYRDEWEDFAMGRERGAVRRRIHRAVKALATRLYRASDAVVAVTAECADSLRTRGVAVADIVPNGADTAVFRPRDRQASRDALGIPASDIVLAYEGTMGGYYRIDVVLDAVAQIRDELRKDARLLLVGPDPDSVIPDLLARSVRLGLRERVLYLGTMSDDRKLAEVLSVADVGLVPYDDDELWRHALPAKFFEYGACGLPIVATVRDDAVLARVVREYDVGLVVPPLDADALARALEELAGDGPRRRRLGENARRAVSERYDRTAFAERFASLARAGPPPVGTVK